MDKSVTDEGVPNELDLGNVEAPSNDDLNNLDKALDAAGVFNQDDSAQPVAPNEATTTQPEDQAQPSEDQTAPDGQQPPQQPAEAKDIPKVEDPSTIDLDKIQPPADISPRNLVNFNKLREVAKHYKEQADKVAQYEQYIDYLKQQQPEPPQDLLAELEDHRKFRKIFDAENDPEFQQQFNNRIGTLDSDVIDILKKNGLPEETEGKLRAMGLEQVPAEWWEENVLPKLNFLDRERVQKKLAERSDVVDAKQKELEKFSSRKDEFFAEQEQKMQQFQEQVQETIHTHLDVMTKDLPQARYLEVPANASPEQFAQIQNHNNAVAEMESHFHDAMNASDPQDRTEVAMAAVASIYFAKEIDHLQAQLQAATQQSAKFAKELEAIRSAGRTPSPRGGVRKASESADPLKLSDMDAIEEGLLAAEGI
jgi:hypothetical protein